MRNGSTLLGALSPKSGKIGAGGFCTGISVANDGTLIVRTDTHNAYVLPTTGVPWQQQLKPGINCSGSALDLAYQGTVSPTIPGLYGTYAAVIAPSNSAVRYLVCMGYVWVTQDSGATYTKCNLAQQLNCNPNETNRSSGQPLAVDPQNPAVCFFGSPNGLFYTADYGANWTTVSTGTIPAPTSGKRMCVAFDPNSSVVSGKKQGIYVFINGTGLRKSTNGGSTWTTPTQPTTTPTAASHMKIGSNGYVYLTGDGADGQGQFRRWNGSAWTEPAGKTCKSVAISPHNAGHVWSVSGGGGLDVSTDYGATWTIGGANSTLSARTATNIGWQAWTKEDFMGNGDIEFDPLVNRLWVAEGIGVWKYDSPSTSINSSSRPNWVEVSPGIENMVSMNITVAPDGTVGYACLDRGTFILPKLSVGVTYPDRHGVDNADNLQHSQMVDYAPEDNAFWAATFYSGGRGTGYTTDRGTTWTRLDTLPTASGGAGGGQIAVLSKDVWLQTQTNSVQPPAGNGAKNGVYLTTNRGSTWSLLTIGDNGAIVSQNAYNIARRILVKDRYTSGRAYFYNMGDGTGGASDLACRGIWRIDINLSNGTPTITRVKSGYIINRNVDFWWGKFTQGSSASEWYWCPGDNGHGLWRSTDGMANWSEVTGTDDQGAGTHFSEIFGFGVGKAFYNSSYLTLGVIGYRMNTPIDATDATGYGFWISTDNGATWTRVAQFLGGIFDTVNDMAGDPNKYGKFFIGYGGTGLGMLDYDYTMRYQ